MSDCHWPNCGCPKLTNGPWCKATVRPSITWTVVQPAAAIAALVMRERAAKACDGFCSECARALRALPTTFTDAELLAAAMQLPEVRALLEALRSKTIMDPDNSNSTWLDAAARAALAPFKGGE
jgi:hypothetical protein